MALRIQSLPVSETNYEETMKTVVEPYLASIRKEENFLSFDSKPIHYEGYVTEGARGAIILVHGFTESAEKLRELSYSFIKMGLNVYAIDNRGHGNSYRICPQTPQTVSIGKFEDYVEDLHVLAKRIVKPANPGLPLFLFCHSMGGAIGVQYLQTHPETFDKAILSSPMIEPQMPVPPAVSNALASAFILFGQADKKVFVHGDFDPAETYENSHDTSKARFDYYHAKRIANPLLQTNAASYRWLKEAVKVSKLNVDPARCKRITMPVLLFQPEEDRAVVSAKEDEFISLIPNGRLVKLTGCRHEIYASVDATVLEYLQTMEKFLFGEE